MKINMDSYSVIIITDNTTPAMLQVPRYDSWVLDQFIDNMMADRRHTTQDM